MKNLVKFLVPAAVAALAIVSCNKEDNYTTPDVNTVTIRVQASVGDMLADDSATKTYLDEYNSKPNTVLWGDEEYMKIAVTAGENTHFATSAEANANGLPNATFSFSVEAFDGSPSSYLYQGVYPASATTANSNNNHLLYKVNLPTIQNAAATSYDPSAYIMIAKPKEMTSLDDWSDAEFRRATALNKITLKNVPSEVSINRVKITATGKKLAGGRHFNLSTGESGDIYGTEATIEVKYATALSGSNVDVWFTSWGVELAASESLTIVAYTTNKKSYTKTINLTGDQKISFKEGYLNTLGANMSGISPEDVTELDEGNYLILAKNNSTYYALKAEAEGTRMNYEDYIGSTSSFAGAANLVWTVAKTANGYSIANDGKFLGWASGNTATLEAAGESWTTTNYEMDITWDTDHYTVAVHNDNTRKLAKNSGSYGFAFYGGSGYNSIIFVPATVDNRTAVSLTFDNDQVNLTPAQAAQYLGEDLTISPDVAAVSGHLTWDYEDNDGIIDEFDEGALTLTGDEGTATVSVSFVGDENYLPASASYTITVAAASAAEPEWVETAIGDLTTSDVFVIVGSTGPYAMTNDNGTGSAPATASVTVSGTKLTGTIADNIKWNISGNATDGYTFYPNGNSNAWLYCTATNNGVRVGTNANKLFTLDANGYLVNSATSRYISIYNNQDWRCYGNTNNNPQVVKFYKYVDVPDTRDEAPISWSSTSGTATWSSSGISSTLPSLSNTNSLAVSYASSDEAVATIANDGTVTILSGGSTSISATYDGSAANAPYKTTTVSYTLTVTDNRTACATPSFSPAAGEVESGDVITITSATTGATIYYTTGNSEFSAGDWTQYTAPVAVSSSCTIKAIAVKANYLNSEVASATYTIAASASTIAQVLAGGANTYTINNILVYSVVGNQAIVGDSTGKMVLYKSGHGLAVGDNISIPAATVAEYNGILQIQDGTFNNNSTGNAVDHGTATNLNDATVATSTLSTFSASGHHAAQFVTMNGTQSGRNINGTNASLYLSAANTTYDGQAVIVTGYIYYYNDTHSNYNFQLVSIEVDNTIPSVSVSPASLSWAAAETDSKSLTVTLNGGAAVGDYEYSVTSGTATDWNISDNGSGTITVSPKAANSSTTAAKSITLRISHADDGSVYQDVECSQGKAGNTTTTEEITSGTFSGTTASLSMTTSSGITITQLKGEGTNCNSTYNTVSTLRVYRANQMQFTGKTFTKIEMYYTGTYSGASWSVVAGGGTVTIDTVNKKVVWTNTSGASTVTLQNSTSSGTNTQLRTTKFYFEY